MEAQQLATKVAQLESRVATLEDEGKIVKGEVKQILTEIRSAILVRDNPFEGDGGMGARPGVAVVSVTSEPLPSASGPQRSQRQSRRSAPTSRSQRSRNRSADLAGTRSRCGR